MRIKTYSFAKLITTIHSRIVPFLVEDVLKLPG